MRVFAIADLHLATVTPKPMTVFGPQWAGHPEAIWAHWRETVREEDVVLLPGDLSWAMRLPDAMTDLSVVAGLPGTKVLLRGNHDYWWPTASRLRAALPPGMLAVVNDAVRVGNVVICGSRGWTTPGHDALNAEDERLLTREAERLSLSLKAAQTLRQPGDHLLMMLHYPPARRAAWPKPSTRSRPPPSKPKQQKFKQGRRTLQRRPCFLVGTGNSGCSPLLGNAPFESGLDGLYALS